MNLLPTEGGEGGGEERVKKGEIEWAPSLAKAPALNVKYLNNRPGTRLNKYVEKILHHKYLNTSKLTKAGQAKDSPG